LKIIEQIVPNFAPDFSPDVLLIPEMNEQRKIPIVLTGGPVMTDVYDDGFKKRRFVLWTLSFTMKAWFFPPIKQAPIIKFANTTFYAPVGGDVSGMDYYSKIDTANAEPLITVLVQPGELANGSPTSNSSTSIPVANIAIDSDFGFVTAFQDLILANT